MNGKLHLIKFVERILRTETIIIGRYIRPEKNAGKNLLFVKIEIFRSQ